MRRLVVVGWLLGGLGAACGSKLDPNALSTAATGDGGLGGGGDGGDGGSSTPFDAAVDGESPSSCPAGPGVQESFELDGIPAPEGWNVMGAHAVAPEGGVQFAPDGYIQRLASFCEKATFTVDFRYDPLSSGSLTVGIVEFAFGPIVGPMTFGFDGEGIFISHETTKESTPQNVGSSEPHTLEVIHDRDKVTFGIDGRIPVTYTNFLPQSYELRIGAPVATNKVTITSVRIDMK